MKRADIVRPTGALYIQNLDGEKDAEGMVRSYFPSSRGFKFGALHAGALH